MKYFTPERYVALQDFSSDEAMNAADAEWQTAVERYDEYYRSIECQLPQGLRTLQECYYLHDALISNMGREGNQFVIILQLDTPPHDLLVVEYELTGEPTILDEALPTAHRQQGVIAWMHDEIERTSSEPIGWTQSILFSNGWEVRLPCRDVHIRQLTAISPRCGVSTATQLPTFT